MKKCAIAATLILIAVALFAFFMDRITPKSAQAPQPYPLHVAAVHYPDKISGLILEGEAVDGLDDNGVTALWHAAMHRKHAGVANLLAAGADPNATSAKDDSAIAIAAFWGEVETVRLLISKGANVNGEHAGRGALAQAIIYGHSEIVDLLLEQPTINRDQVAVMTGYTPLHFAVLHGRKEVVETLLAQQANASLRDGVGNTAQDLASPNADMVHLFTR